MRLRLHASVAAPVVNTVKAATIVSMTAIALSACGEDPNESSAPPVEYEVPLASTFLDNGLEVVVLPNSTVPIVTMLFAFRAGAFVEGDSRDGYSHLLEHMLFKGSEEVPDALEYRDRLAAAGALHNAYTYVDRVAYYFTSQRSNLDEVFDLYTGAIRNPALDPDELEREKDVVFAEMDLAASNWGRVHTESTNRLLLGEFSDRYDALGSREVVSTATQTTLREMHSQFYMPNNGLLVLSGDLDAEEGFQLADDALSDWAAGPDPFSDDTVPIPPPVEQNVAEIIEAPVSESRLRISWFGPALGDRRAVLAGALLSTMTSFNEHSIGSVIGGDRARYRGLYFHTTAFTTIITVDLLIPMGNEERALASVVEAIDALDAPDNVPQELLESAKDENWARQFYRSDDPTAAAFDVVQRWSVGSVADYVSYTDDIYEVTTDDVREFVRIYMKEANHVAVLMTSPEVASSPEADGWLDVLR
jgi:zinc protease